MASLLQPATEWRGLSCHSPCALDAVTRGISAVIFWAGPKLTGDWNCARDRWTAAGFAANRGVTYTLHGIPSGIPGAGPLSVTRSWAISCWVSTRPRRRSGPSCRFT
jgi:hypothetical protein